MDNSLRAFLLFLTLALLIYAGANYYLYRRVMQAAWLTGAWMWALKLTLLILILSYPLGRALEGFSRLHSLFTWMGALWLGALYYGLLFAWLFDVIRLADPLLGWIPNFLHFDRILMGRLTLAVSLLVVSLLLTGGRVRAMFPVSKEIPLEIAKLPPEREEYRVAFVSDFHLGTLVGERRFRRIIGQINELSPDLILLGGDLIDERSERMRWIIEPLKELQAPDGVFAVTGNHEYYAGLEDFEKLMAEAGIPLLKDSLRVIAGALNLAGLNDVAARTQFRNSQPSIQEILSGKDPNLPVILMHHTPQRIVEAAAAGVDVMLCGHTHGGQIWPASLLTRLIFRMPQGLSRFGNMSIYLSNGVGTWGPPVRVGAEPEVIFLILKPAGGTTQT